MNNYLVDIVYEFTLPNGKHAWAESNSLVPASSEGEAFAAASRDLVDVVNLLLATETPVGEHRQRDFAQANGLIKVLHYQVHESYGVVRLGLASKFKTKRDALDVADIFRRNMDKRRAQDEAFRRNMDELLSDDEDDPEPQETRNADSGDSQ